MFNSSDKKLCATKDKVTHLGKMSQPLLTNDIDASTEDSISSVNVKEGILFQWIQNGRGINVRC